MSDSNASACSREPSLRVFVVGNLDVESDDCFDASFPLVHDLDETELDLTGIEAWLGDENQKEPVMEQPVTTEKAQTPDEHPDVFRDFLRDIIFNEEATGNKRSAERLDNDSNKRHRPPSLSDVVTRSDLRIKTTPHKDSDTSIDDGKMVRLKRNRASAAESRERKKNEIENLKRQVRQLEKANQHLSYATQCLSAENTAMRCRLGFQPGAPLPPETFLMNDRSQSGHAPLEGNTSKNTRTKKVTEPAALDWTKASPFMLDDFEKSSASPRECFYKFVISTQVETWTGVYKKGKRSSDTRRARRRRGEHEKGLL